MKNLSKRCREINRQLLNNALSILPQWLKGSKENNEFVALNPTREDHNLGSFKINLKTGEWKDFAVENFSGKGLVSLYIRLNNIDKVQAVEKLGHLLSTVDSAVPKDKKLTHTTSTKPDVVSAPAPSDCHLPPDIHPDLGLPSKIFRYMTADGQGAFYVYRFETNNGKETRPISYNPETQDFQWKYPVGPYPLYHLDQITQQPELSVVVVEGEKAADSAQKLFPGAISTTSASGSNNALKSDWSPLYGREVTIIPDADAAGISYAKEVAAELLVNGATVYVIDTLALGWMNGEDVADYPDIDPQWLEENRIPFKQWREFKAMDDLLVTASARLDPFDYDRRKDDLVTLFGGVGKRTLDSKVNEVRKTFVMERTDNDQSNVLFPLEEPWKEPVGGKALVSEIKSIVRSHVILTNYDALAVALWILFTYVFSSFRVCPRLLISSPEKRCGKTTLLETIQALCSRGLAAANISAASLYRGIEAWTPTLLIDEADTFLKNNDELRGILNSGHTRSTAYVIRTVGEDHEPYRFSTFSPIAIGMIKQPADTLLDRSITIRLRRKLGAESVKPLPLEVEQDYRRVRQKCLRWVEDHTEKLFGDRNLTPENISNDRARDNWIPLMAIARQCGVLDEAYMACLALTLEDDASPTIELLQDIQTIFREQGKDKLPSQILVKELIALEERPWLGYSRGKDLTPNQLARMLKDFDVSTHQGKIPVGGKMKNLNHYWISDLQPVFDRYLQNKCLPLPLEVTATPLPQALTLETTRLEKGVVEVVVPADESLPDQIDLGPVVGEVSDKTLPLPSDPHKSLLLLSFPVGSEVVDEDEE